MIRAVLEAFRTEGVSLETGVDERSRERMKRVRPKGEKRCQVFSLYPPTEPQSHRAPKFEKESFCAAGNLQGCTV